MSDSRHVRGNRPRSPFRVSTALATVAVVLAAGAATAAAAPLPRFVVPDESPAPGLLPQDVIAGDFTGDGRMDAAVANDGPDGVFGGGVAVLPGNGAGALGNAIETKLPTDWGASELATADFDEDGNLDLVAVASTSSGFGPIFVLLGNGDGSFVVDEQLANGQDMKLATADFDLDGNADFAASSNTVADIDIRFGDGAGNFPTTRDLNPPFDTFDFVVADMEGDGDIDLFGASGGTPFSMLNNGDGTFAPGKTSANIFGIDLTVDHFDADGLLDIAVGNASDGTVITGLGNPDGTFTRNAIYGNLALQVDAVTSGDVTGDGRIDLVTNGDDNTSNLLLGRGDGNFQPPTMFVTGQSSLITARMNGDNRDDLLALVQDPGRVFLSLGVPKGVPRSERDRDAQPG